VSIVLGPLSVLMASAADVLARLAGVPAGKPPPVTHEEIKAMLSEGLKAGVFELAEHDIFKRVFRFCDRKARVIMTPRDDVVWIDLADPPEEIRRKVINSRHSRFPVCDQSLDNLLGIVQVKDLLGPASNGTSFRVKGFLTMPAFIYEGARGPQILECLKKSSTRTAVVLDEYGSVIGLITLNDLLEAVLGGLPESPTDNEEDQVVQRPDGSWLIDGRFPLDEFRDLFDLPDLQNDEIHTLAGLVVTRLGRLPRIAESFEYLGLQFEVVDMDAKRVDRVLIRTMAGEKSD
jgi:putative hemolysin